MQTPETVNPSKRLTAAEARAAYEAQLQQLWQELDCEREYELADQRRIRIEAPGEINYGAGPDFLNARIEIDGRKAVGDIEIHRNTSGWYQHHHHLDPRYRQVILHVVEKDDLPADGNLPPVLTFAHLKKVVTNRSRRKCHLFFHALNDETVSRILIGAGLERFAAKAEKMLRESLRHGLNHAVLAAWADALGYRNNREAFAGLTERFMEHPESDRRNYAEAIIWGESGLLPDPAVTELPPEMKAFVGRLWQEWGGLCPAAHGPLPWVRNGNRPYNSPERRVAALAGLVGRTRRTACVPGLAATELAARLADELTISDKLWDGYTSFTTPATKRAAILGRDRALELAVNVTLPALHAEATMMNDPVSRAELTELSRDAWLALPPPQDNQIIRLVKKEWFPGRDTRAIFATAAAVQGALHLYREFCAQCQSDCASCLFYNSFC